MMNDMEFLRTLIDLIDAKRAAPPVIVNVNVNSNGTVDTDSGEEVETAMDRDDVFIPPLQAKIEMMKKMTGVEPKNQDMIASDDDGPFEE